MNHPIRSTRLLFALITLLAVVACDDDDDDGNPTVAERNVGGAVGNPRVGGQPQEGGGEADSTVPERGVPSFFEITLFGIPALEGLLTDEVGLDEAGFLEPETFKRLEPQAGLEYGPTQGRLVISRGIYTFDLARITPGSTIEFARIFLFQQDVVGRPYAFLEEIVVDHIDTSSFAELDPSLFDDFTLESDFGTISEDRSLGLKVLDVTAQVQADIDAGRFTSSFRLRGLKEQLFQLEGNDQAIFTDSLNELGLVPEMDVLYELP